jgi:CRP/FNR family cyclic AMP-dependent transcriptional regulator
MAASQIVFAPQKPLEDPLDYLPCTSVVKFKRGQIIYDADQPASHVYLVISGKVKIARPVDGGRMVVMDVYQADEFFGEAALLGLPNRAQQAIAIEETQVMMWGSTQLEAIIAQRPKLAVALVQTLLQRNIESEARIESFAMDNITRRLAHALIRFCERMGERQEDGSVRLSPFTHELLGQYVGTSREIVTHYMNRLRRQGHVRYSRRAVVLYVDALKDWLRQASA